MPLHGYPKTFKSPKITARSVGDGDLTVTGIIDLIKVSGSGSAGTDHGDFEVWFEGDDKSQTGRQVELNVGDVLEGPFIQAKFDSTASNGGSIEALFYERSNVS